MSTVVMVPFRSDNGHRAQLWDYLLDGYWQQFGWPVFVGGHHGGRFNRSAAVNEAARAACVWDVAVIADSDTWVPPGQLRRAVGLAVESGRLVSALSGVVEFDRDCTEAMLAARFSEKTLSVGAVRTDELATQSSMLVVTRQLWDNIGGFDEQFSGGWGGEDNAFWRAASILAGAPLRVPGFAFHLWHEPAATDTYKRSDPGYRANLLRWHKYRVARTVQQLRQAQR
jgi:hypothetical protein